MTHGTEQTTDTHRSFTLTDALGIVITVTVLHNLMRLYLTGLNQAMPGWLPTPSSPVDLQTTVTVLVIAPIKEAFVYHAGLSGSVPAVQRIFTAPRPFRFMAPDDTVPLRMLIGGSLLVVTLAACMHNVCSPAMTGLGLLWTLLTLTARTRIRNRKVRNAALVTLIVLQTFTFASPTAHREAETAKAHRG